MALLTEEKKNPTPPYVAYATFKNSVRGLKHGNNIPAQIDASVFSTMSGSGKNQLFGTLKFFSLLADEKGTPTPRLRELALSDENTWNRLMGQMLHERYEPQLKVLKTGTPQSLSESFGDIGGIVKPAVRFLLAACKDTGIEVSPYILSDGKKKGNGAPRKRKPKPGAEGAGQTPPAGTPPPPAGHESFAMALLAKFPAFDTSWSSEQQASWFEAYQKLLALDGKSEKETAT